MFYVYIGKYSSIASILKLWPRSDVKNYRKEINIAAAPGKFKLRNEHFTLTVTEIYRLESTGTVQENH